MEIYYSIDLLVYSQMILIYIIFYIFKLYLDKEEKKRIG
jgi:hypothetical protein